MTNEKHSHCISKVFKTDISQLCENCPLPDYIQRKVEERIIFKAEQRRSLLPKQDFLEYLLKEMEEAEDCKERQQLIENYSDGNEDPFRANRILLYIYNNERIKALRKFQEDAEKPARPAVQSFSWKGTQDQKEALCEALKDAGYIDPKTDFKAFAAIFADKLISSEPIHWKGSNRLLAYLFDQMNSGNPLIRCQEWQNLIGKYRLFKNKTGKVFTAGDLATAKNSINDPLHGLNPKGSEIIDAILKKVKTLRP